MLRRYRFYVSLCLGGGWTGENLLLWCVDARQSCSCGVGTSARAAPAWRGRPEEPFWRILAALKGRVFWGAAIPLRGSVAELMRLLWEISGNSLLAVFKFMDGKGPRSIWRQKMRQIWFVQYCCLLYIVYAGAKLTSAGAKKTSAGANFPRFTLLLGRRRRKSDTGEAYIC
jgi:hypothetical protein